MKKVVNTALRWASSAAMSVAAFGVLSLICRTWLYQPSIAAKLTADME